MTDTVTAPEAIHRLPSNSTAPRVAVGCFEPPHTMLMLTIDRPDLLTPEELDAKLEKACRRLRDYHREIQESAS